MVILLPCHPTAGHRSYQIYAKPGATHATDVHNTLHACIVPCKLTLVLPDTLATLCKSKNMEKKHDTTSLIQQRRGRLGRGVEGVRGRLWLAAAHRAGRTRSSGRRCRRGWQNVVEPGRGRLDPSPPTLDPTSTYRHSASSCWTKERAEKFGGTATPTSSLSTNVSLPPNRR